jgi:tetratricopeptide (TPR) repeat protein
MPPADKLPAEDKSEKPSLAARLRAALAGARGLPAWAKEHRLLAAAIGAGAALAVALVAILPFVFSHEEKVLPPEEQLELAFAALDAGDRDAAAAFAEQLRDARSLQIEQMGGPPYILGVIAGQRADENWSKDQAALHLLAASLLEEAHIRGFPPSREAEGAYLLGRHLYLAGKIAASRLPLEEAIDRKHPRSAEIHGLLADVNLSDPNPRLQDALVHNAKYLEHPRLSPEDRQGGLLQRSRIQLLLGDLAACRTTLEQIPADSSLRSEVAILRAQALMREAESTQDNARAKDASSAEPAAEKYRRAIAILRAAQERDTLHNQSTPKAMYLIGQCYAKLDDMRAALAQFQSVIKRFSGSPEAAAADFQSAQIQQQTGHAEESVAGYGRVLDLIGKEDGGGNPWFTIDELRAACQAAYEDFLKQRQFGAAVEMAKRQATLVTPVRSLQWEAGAHQAWGRWLAQQAAAAAPAEIPALEEQAFVQFRHAGRVYLRLAAARFTTRDYPDDLWNGAESYLDGHDYKNAIKAINEYLKIELRRRRPLALVALGQALLAQDRPDEALTALRRAIDDYPRDPAIFKARLLASAAYLAKGSVQPAEAALLANLNDSPLAPASQEWRDSLFALGRLLYRAGRYRDAIGRLDEAVARYPADEQSLEARYLLAAAHAHAAYAAQNDSASQPTAQQRLKNAEQIEQSWRAALEQNDKLLQEIAKRQDEKPLSAAEKAMFRNGYFGRAEALFALGRYDQAIKAYSDVVNRYQNEPEVLDAYLQLSECYRRLGQPLEARSALEQAKIVLTQLKDNAPFTEVTNRRRDEWTHLLNALTAD